MASKAAAFTGITAWLYYHSLWAMIALTPIFIWEYRKSKEECERKKRQKFLLQFKEMIQSMAAALGTGYSVENAMKETQKELKIIYSQNEIISKEMAHMIGQIRVQVPVEQILEEFACRAGEEKFCICFFGGKEKWRRYDCDYSGYRHADERENRGEKRNRYHSGGKAV